MKKNRAYPAIILMTIWSSCLCALPLGNPSEPMIYTDSFWSDVGSTDFCSPEFCFSSAWNVRFGFYGDYVFNRHLERVSFSEHRNVDQTQLYTNAGFIAVNFFERLDLFGTLGSTTIFEQNEEIVGLTSVLTELNFVPHFSWSVGARAALWECNHFILGIEGQYFRTTPRFDFLLNYFDGSFFYLGDHHYVTYSEWQVGLALAYHFSLPCTPLAFIPYMGILWSEAHFDLNDLAVILNEELVTFPNFQSEKLWGYGLGMTFLLGDVIGINIEGRFASEKALSVQGQFRF